MRTSDPPRSPPDPGAVSLATLPVGARGTVVAVGSAGSPLSPLERRLLEFGFVHGEHVEVLTEARPGRDPFVVRVGHTTLALRRREVQSVWVNSITVAAAQAAPRARGERVELQQ